MKEVAAATPPAGYLAALLAGMDIPALINVCMLIYAIGLAVRTLWTGWKKARSWYSDWHADRFYRRAKRKIARANRKERGAANPRVLAGVAFAALGLAAALVGGFEVRDHDHPNLLSYQDSGGIWTDCYGHTRGVKPGTVATKEQCDAWLAEDLKIAAFTVDLCITVPMDASKRAALISFAFNVGPGAAGVKDGLCMLKNGRQPIVRRAANAGDWPRACNALLEWTTAGGVELRGLVKRRKAERDLCMRADFGNVESGAMTA